MHAPEATHRNSPLEQVLGTGGDPDEPGSSVGNAFLKSGSKVFHEGKTEVGKGGTF